MTPIDVSSHVGWPVYVGLALFAAWLVWILKSPDYWWRLERSLVGWQYQDGHRIELSAAGRAWARICTAVTLVGLCVLAGATIRWTAESRVETGRWPSGGTVYDVGDPVESPGCPVRIFVCLRSEAVFPIPVAEYETVDAADPRLTGTDALPAGTSLLLYVDRQFFPAQLVVEQGEQVTVTLYGKCAPPGVGDTYGRSRSDCAEQPAASISRGVVPVRLTAPLDGRTVIDGSRNAALCCTLRLG